ncbi:MarR family transcriptional regulator [Brevibacillus sp. HB1.2]|uniref:MarR family winged helix-turn-helix transcriptional regulator n=1 Tax=Brevibacillus TaxID=55080 RepID=UPI00156B73D5|nr:MULTISPECIES: MarR family transcriptional regulator [unclassified Brevibacillus]NRS17175.1 MarR family transcriptional regulator [Brevibacillus sp. HB1.4B]NTU21156.1 MarR family transcriptional regulator [Brevibacillus sp. HB1.2]NTU30755.1 MarR family transcriptional regulator [Brevibacillus sp. HB1.1]
MADDLETYVNQPPLRTKAFFSLVDATTDLVGLSEKYWHAKGMNGARIRLLVEIAKHGDSILPSRLAACIGVTKANISLLLAPLETDGLIHRAPHPKDGRKSVISLTEAGKQLLFEHLPGNRQIIAEGLRRLEEQELHQLIFLLEKIRQSVR